MDINIIKELVDKIIEADNKLTNFAGGMHMHHNICCNYDIPFEGQKFCNCGVADLHYATKLAKKIKEEL